MTLGIDSTVRSSRADVIRDAIDSDASAGILRIFDGVRPATGGSITNVLATLELADPVAPNAVGGVSTWSAIAGVTASMSGTATWFRVTDGITGHVFDGDVGVSGSDLNFNTVTFTAGLVVSISSFVLTEADA